MAVGTSAGFQDLVDVVELLAGIEFVHNIVYKLQVFQHQVARRNFRLLAKINQLAFQPVARGAPLVLHDQGATIESKSLVRRVEFVQLGDCGLDQRRQRNGFVHPHGDVADPELESIEEWMGANVPPDFFGVVDALGLDQQLDEILVFPPAGKIVWNISAREFIKNLAAVRFQPRVNPKQKGEIGGNNQDVGQKIAD